MPFDPDPIKILIWLFLFKKCLKSPLVFWGVRWFFLMPEFLKGVNQLPSGCPTVWIFLLPHDGILLVLLLPVYILQIGS